MSFLTRAAATLILFAAMLFARANVFEQKKPQYKAEPEEYAVYSAAITDFYQSEKRLKLILIDNWVRVWNINDLGKNQLKKFLKGIQGVSAEQTDQLIDDFAARNKQSVTLEKMFTLKTKYTLVDQDAYSYMSSVKEDNPYIDAHNIVELSRVGFTADKTQALVTRGFFCGMLCGGGDALLLVNKRDGWHVIGTERIWDE